MKLFLSAAVLEEVREVLHRPAIRKAFPKLTDEHVQNYIEHLLDKGHMAQHVPSVVLLDRDPDDEPFINLAIATRAEFIVSRDKDLLDLMQEVEFCTAYPALRILDPVAFLKHVRTEIAR